MPASVEGSLNSAYLAPNTFINKREIAKQVFPRYREDTLFDFLFYTNRKVESVQTRFNWFEWGGIDESAYTSPVRRGRECEAIRAPRLPLGGGEATNEAFPSFLVAIVREGRRFDITSLEASG